MKTMGVFQIFYFYCKIQFVPRILPKLIIFFSLEQDLHPPRKCLFGIYYRMKAHLYYDFRPIKWTVINYFNFIYLFICLFWKIKCRIKQ